MHHDIHGLAISTQSAAAADAFNDTLRGYLKYRADLPQRLGRTLEADANFALAHVLRGYLMMLSYKQANVAAAREAADAARPLPRTRRESLHLAALDAWIAADLDRALATWEDILASDPTDVLALRLSHFNYFWLGRANSMRASLARVAGSWSPELEGWGTLLSCECFAHEECGDYETAEPKGRAAVELDPGDVWGTHAVAHVLEMLGRHDDGIAWLKGLEANWKGAANLVHHLYWHRSMYHLERGEFDVVLDLYDRCFRDLAGPLTLAAPDVYIDIQNASSMLFRLERQGIDVGDRWTEIADKAEARIGDCVSAFTLPHWMMALAATGRYAAGKRMLEEMRAAGRTGGTVPTIVGRVAVPVCEAVLAHRRGDHELALVAMRPVLGELYRLGGSHAQQDVLKQLFVDCAVKAGRGEDARLILAHLRARYPHVQPEERIGYRDAARRFAA